MHVRFNYSGFTGACTAALTPWSLDVPVGPLDAGEYTVEVSRLLTLVPPQKIGTGTFTVTPMAESTVWLPGFSAPGATYSLASTLTAFDNSDEAATVTFVGAWDALGEYTPPPPAVLAPAAAGILDSRSLREGQPVQMLALRAPRRVAVRATLERLETVPEGLPKVPESLGRVELPVFTEMRARRHDRRRRRRVALRPRVRERARGAPPREPHALQRGRRDGQLPGDRDRDRGRTGKLPRRALLHGPREVPRPVQRPRSRLAPRLPGGSAPGSGSRATSPSSPTSPPSAPRRFPASSRTRSPREARPLTRPPRGVPRRGALPRGGRPAPAPGFLSTHVESRDGPPSRVSR